MNAWMYDALVIVGVMVMTLGLIGMYRMPDIYTKSHAASKSVFLGVMVLGLSSAVLDNGAFTGKIVLICLALLVATPVSSHAIGKAALVLHERMDSPGAIDESGSHLAASETPDWRM